MALPLDDLVAAYIDHLPIRPIAVSIEPGGRTRLGIGLVPHVTDALWFSKPAHAELVAMTVADDFRSLGAVDPDGLVDLHVNTVRDHVINVAGLLGAPWQTDHQIRISALFQVEKITFALEMSRRSGDLREVNASYKMQRMAAAAEGRKMCSYQTHLLNFARGLVVLAAQHADA